MTRLIVWRHGRTEWNVSSRVQGHTDVDLDDIGLREAAEAAPAIAAFGPDLIVSSDLRRAAHTAAALAEVTGLPVEYDARLRERDFGPWQGLTVAEIERDYPGRVGPLARRRTADHHRDRDRGRPRQARHARVPGHRRPGRRGDHRRGDPRRHGPRGLRRTARLARGGVAHPGRPRKLPPRRA